MFYNFSLQKNLSLKILRGVDFLDVIVALWKGGLLDVMEHPNKLKYPNQKVYIVEVRGYAYAVPFVEMAEGGVFLKTLFPSRKLTKRYLNSH